MKQSGNYWKERFRQLEEAQNNISVSKTREIQEQFEKAQAAINGKIDAWYQRFAANNGISMAEARRMLSAQELKEFQWNVEDYIKYGKENAVSQAWEKQLENASARVHISRLESLKLEVQQELERMYGNYLDSVDQHIKDLYTSGFYHSAYEIQKGVGIGSSFQRLDSDVVEKIISKPWAVDGKNFSDRIWENKTKLINQVHNSLSVMCITGEAPDRAIQEIAKNMNVSRSQAGRLVMTESAAFAGRARADCMKSLGVEEFEVVESLDHITCDYCQSMDGKHFPMGDFQIGVTAPPFHPNCRGCTCPYFDDEFTTGEERAARGEDGKVYYVPSDMTYEEWEKSFVEEVVANDRLGLITNNDKSNSRYYDYKGKTVDVVERDIAENNYETAVCFDKKGRAIFAQVQESEEHEVRFTKYQMHKMNGLDVTHNHPYNTPPSPEDLYNILRNGKPRSFRTCGRNGTYVLEYSKAIENLPSYEVFDKDYNDYSDNLMKKYLRKIEEKELTVYEAEIQMQEETWEYLSKKYDIKYYFERRV